MWYTDPTLCNCRHILLKNIRRSISIGAYEHERLAHQQVVINLELFASTEQENDDLSRAYNYDDAVACVDNILTEDGHIALQETLVEAIAKSLLEDERLVAVIVRSEKPEAYETVDAACVEIFKKR